MSSGRTRRTWWQVKSWVRDMRKVGRYNVYRLCPRARIEWEGGYIEVSLDFLENGPKKKTNKIWALARKYGGWKIIQHD